MYLKLFVDPDNPFVDPGHADSSPQKVKLDLGRKGVIPCRTSSPDYKVVFACVCDSAKVYGPEEGIDFDPKIGIQIDQVVSSFDGNYKCMAVVPTPGGVKTYSRTFHVMVPIKGKQN